MDPVPLTFTTRVVELIGADIDETYDVTMIGTKWKVVIIPVPLSTILSALLIQCDHIFAPSGRLCQSQGQVVGLRTRVDEEAHIKGLRQQLCQALGVYYQIVMKEP